MLLNLTESTVTTPMLLRNRHTGAHRTLTVNPVESFYLPWTEEKTGLETSGGSPRPPGERQQSPPATGLWLLVSGTYISQTKPWR